MYMCISQVCLSLGDIPAKYMLIVGSFARFNKSKSQARRDAHPASKQPHFNKISKCPMQHLSVRKFICPFIMVTKASRLLQKSGENHFKLGTASLRFSKDIIHNPPQIHLVVCNAYRLRAVGHKKCHIPRVHYIHSGTKCHNRYNRKTKKCFHEIQDYSMNNRPHTMKLVPISQKLPAKSL